MRRALSWFFVEASSIQLTKISCSKLESEATSEPLLTGGEGGIQCEDYTPSRIVMRKGYGSGDWAGFPGEPDGFFLFLSFSMLSLGTS